MGRRGRGINNHARLAFSPSAFFLRHHCAFIYSVHISIHIPSFVALLPPLLQAIVRSSCAISQPTFSLGPLRRPATPPATALAAQNARISQPRLPCVHPQGDDIVSLDPIATSCFHFTIQSATTRTREEDSPSPTLLRTWLASCELKHCWSRLQRKQGDGLTIRRATTRDKNHAQNTIETRREVAIIAASCVAKHQSHTRVSNGSAQGRQTTHLSFTSTASPQST